MDSTTETTRHFVLIDSNSGYVWNEIDAVDPIEACRLTDRQCGEERAHYEEYSDHSQLAYSHYRVYEADADWASPNADGQDGDYIEAVEALPCVAKVIWRDEE